MGRPSQGIDKALLRAGMDEIREKGVRGLSVRSVCGRAKVSIRMLNYHFGSKDNFVRLLLSENYDGYTRELQQVAASSGSPLDRLRRAVELFANEAIANREIARSLWVDIYAGEPLVLEAIGNHFPTHIQIFLSLVREAQRQGELRQDMDALQIFMAVFSGVFMPNLWAEGLLPHIAAGIYPPKLGVDPLEKALQNFDCLIMGYKPPLSGTETVHLKPTGPPPPRSRKITGVRKRLRSMREAFEPGEPPEGGTDARF